MPAYKCITCEQVGCPRSPCRIFANWGDAPTRCMHHSHEATWLLMQPIRPRKELTAFVQKMEGVLQENDAEKGDSWKEMNYVDLEDLLLEKFDTVVTDYSGNDIDMETLVDLANYAMMLWNRLGLEKGVVNV